MVIIHIKFELVKPGEILIIEVDPDGKRIQKHGKDQRSTNM